MMLIKLTRWKLLNNFTIVNNAEQSNQNNHDIYVCINNDYYDGIIGHNRQAFCRMSSAADRKKN